MAITYGNIKGTSLALNKPINVINFDAYSGLKNEEGRHNRNSFTYASAEGFLANYFIFGLHENCTSNEIFKILDQSETLHYNTFDALEIRKDSNLKKN